MPLNPPLCRPSPLPLPLPLLPLPLLRFVLHRLSTPPLCLCLCLFSDSFSIASFSIASFSIASIASQPLPSASFAFASSPIPSPSPLISIHSFESSDSTAIHHLHRSEGTEDDAIAPLTVAKRELKANDLLKLFLFSGSNRVTGVLMVLSHCFL
ncbi:hypothetical protein SLEP1_g20642 [Rubroshorea leprosula]|uniref:Uncharacterized protein n=1 Tax=Rubroshorea leprosula TaxID=152421 RepID=A0AAV5J8S6_9ROSI|nr:hypothetical protein SLEP1_g20642 [Rubroshorea leprosula]